MSARNPLPPSNGSSAPLAARPSARSASTHQRTPIVPFRPRRAAELARLVVCLALVAPAAPAAAVPLSPEALARLKTRPGGEAILAQLSRVPAGVNDLPARFHYTLNRYAAGSVQQIRPVVILVDFPDSVSSTPTAHFDTLVYGVATPYTSMRQFYLENSYSRLEIAGAMVTPWIRMSHPMSYYVGGAGGLGAYPQNGQGLAEEAMREANAYVDFSQF